ncbi:mammalian ependymin-related protein 1-like isoform X1 [Haliotis rubra]|uniref:mammalian ependymin-related protein 1-like isoform X1 n=1 Tax=Haliotis rubra TaxID=36100 RepID=UPI001EE5943F|nr:mammalian ependymin-related protein 1-like isoform X1 [Haliotis rubra]
MFTIVSLVLLAAVALAQQPHPCESPRQFEGRFSIYDEDRQFRAFGRFAYDDTNRRFREIEEMEIGRDREYYDRLYLHNLNLEYRLNLRTRNCTITTLTRPWIPFAVPQDARFRGEGVIGASGIPDEHVTIANFDGTTDGNPYFIIATIEDCVPVTAGFYSNSTGGVLRQFYDITLSTDAKAFTPPAECHPNVTV